MGHFGPKIIVHPQILHNGSAKEVYKIYISNLCKKDLVEGECIIVSLKMLCPQNSGLLLKIFL